MDKFDRRKYDRPVRLALLVVVVFVALGTWMAYLETPLWVDIVAQVAALVIWLRYQYKYWPRKPR